MMNLTYHVVHGLTRTFFKIKGHCIIIDHEKIPSIGPVIVAVNHVSYLDPMMVGSAVTRECAFMGRHDLFHRKWLAWLLPQLGCFPVERGKPDRNAIRLSLDALERNLVLIIFPEGGRSDDGTLQRGEPGVALIVTKSGAPVVPCAVVGPEKMLPVGASKLAKARLKVVFGDPIFFTPDTPREEIVATVMRHIARLLTAHGLPSTAAEDLPPKEELAVESK